MKNEVRPAPVLPKQNESPATQSQTPGDRRRRSIPVGVPPSRKARRTRTLPSSRAESRHLFPQLLHLATSPLRFNQAALGRPRALGLAPAIFGNLCQVQLARGNRGGFQLGRQQPGRLDPVTGLGSRSAHPHGETRRQVAEGDRRGDLVDVLATRPARPAKDLFHFIRPPGIHTATFPPDGLEDKSGGLPSQGRTFRASFLWSGQPAPPPASTKRGPPPDRINTGRRL